MISLIEPNKNLLDLIPIHIADVSAVYYFTSFESLSVEPEYPIEYVCILLKNISVLPDFICCDTAPERYPFWVCVWEVSAKAQLELCFHNSSGWSVRGRSIGDLNCSEFYSKREQNSLCDRLNSLLEKYFK